MAGRAAHATTCRRNAAFLPCSPPDAPRARPFRERTRDHDAGKSGAEPISSQTLASGARSRSCSESAIWRVHVSPTVAGPIRLVWLCVASSSATKRSSRSAVSRETGVSASARGPVGGWTPERPGRMRTVHNVLTKVFPPALRSRRTIGPPPRHTGERARMPTTG